jgi:hypothetical protein
MFIRSTVQNRSMAITADYLRLIVFCNPTRLAHRTLDLHALRLDWGKVHSHHFQDHSCWVSRPPHTIWGPIGCDKFDNLMGQPRPLQGGHAAQGATQIMHSLLES